MTESFSELGINACLVQQCEKLGLRKPTVIQQKCIPKILEGADCIGCSETGSGKTLAFLLPILHRFCEDPYGIYALILSPTRELCYQINDQIAVVGSCVNIRSCVVTGGVEMITQAQELQKKPHIVVATPGRLADHLESCDTFSLRKLKFLVLDEADKLFDGRFNQQIEIIFKALPKQKQILLFSATFTNTFEEMQLASKKVFIWKPSLQENIVETLEQLYVLCPKTAKNGYFVEVIRSFLSDHPEASIMVFTDTCKNCQILSTMLNELGFANVTLNALLTQKQRLLSLQKFKSERFKILIATDVASRGLDIPAVWLVVNHTIPNNVIDYVHRIGRTARAKRKGTAISLVTQHDIARMRSIEEQTGKKFKEYQVSSKEVAKILTQVNVTEREARIKLEEEDEIREDKKMTYKKKRMLALDTLQSETSRTKKRKKAKQLK